MLNEKRTIIVRNCEMHWAKLVQPVEPFGTLQWELQLRTMDEATAKQWEEDYLPVKKVDDEEGVYWKANLKKKALKKDGTENTAPNVVDAAKNPVDGNTVGNGSMGNVMLFQYPYSVAGRTGVSSILSGVQVIDHKVYTPNTATDFDVIDDEAGADDTVDF